jgi:hypothetical protein
LISNKLSQGYTSASFTPFQPVDTVDSVDPLHQYAAASAAAGLTPFEVRFVPLRQNGAGYAFPCDDQGRVNLDALPACTMRNYLYARAMIGLEYERPVVVPTACTC